MLPDTETPIDESSRHFRHFMEVVAPTTGRGQVESREGVCLAWGNVPLPFLNAACLETAVQDVPDLRRRVAVAAGRGTERGVPWLFVLADDWLPHPVAAEAEQVMAEFGLVPALTLTGMAADRLDAPTRVAEALTLREVAGQEAASVLSDLNCTAYDIDLSIGTASITPRMFDGVVASVGFIGDTPVACSGTLPIDGVLYVAFVATDPDHQRRGYAEAVMRHSLGIAEQRFGLTRTTLHATDAGKPVYLRMGYRETARFTAYSLPH
ncbi:hypothetical protein BH23ACI1_BH23ACI1_27340 [soil metagenome]